jgi:hypothetical protein
MKNILDSADVAHLRTLIEKSKHIVITCHVRPDGLSLYPTECLDLYSSSPE